MDELTKSYDAATGSGSMPSTPTAGSAVDNGLVDSYNAAANNTTAPSTPAATTPGQAAPAPVAAPAAQAPYGGIDVAPGANVTGALSGIPTSAYTQQRVDAVGQMYDAQRAARVNELEAAYNASMSDMQAAADKIAPQYQTAANDLAAQYERNRRNFLEGANMNGINTGAGSQQQLAMGSNYQRDFGNVRTSEAEQTAEANRQMANLTSQYQSDIRTALADNDYAKAAALLDEYNNGYQRDLANAELLARYGDFSGYESVYGPDTAAGMRNIWLQQNPDVAFVTGQITEAQRDNIKMGRPINEGLDANGNRIRRAVAGGGGLGINRSQSDILRDELTNMDNYSAYLARTNNPNAADYAALVEEAHRNTNLNF